MTCRKLNSNVTPLTEGPFEEVIKAVGGLGERIETLGAAAGV